MGSQWLTPGGLSSIPICMLLEWVGGKIEAAKDVQ